MIWPRGVKLRTMAPDERERLESALTRRWLDLRDHLDERSRRLWLAAEAKALGFGGITLVPAVTKVAKEAGETRWGRPRLRPRRSC